MVHYTSLKTGAMSVQFETLDTLLVAILARIIVSLPVLLFAKLAWNYLQPTKLHNDVQLLENQLQEAMDLVYDLHNQVQTIEGQKVNLLQQQVQRLEDFQNSMEEQLVPSLQQQVQDLTIKTTSRPTWLQMGFWLSFCFNLIMGVMLCYSITHPIAAACWVI